MRRREVIALLSGAPTIQAFDVSSDQGTGFAAADCVAPARRLRTLSLVMAAGMFAG